MAAVGRSKAAAAAGLGSGGSATAVRYVFVPADISRALEERVAHLEGNRVPCDASHVVSLLLGGGGAPAGFSHRYENEVVLFFPTCGESKEDQVPLFFFKRTTNRSQEENARAKALLDAFSHKLSKKQNTFYGDVCVFWRASVDSAKYTMKVDNYTLEDIRTHLEQWQPTRRQQQRQQQQQNGTAAAGTQSSGSSSRQQSAAPPATTNSNTSSNPSASAAAAQPPKRGFWPSDNNSSNNSTATNNNKSDSTTAAAPTTDNTWASRGRTSNTNNNNHNSTNNSSNAGAAVNGAGTPPNSLAGTAPTTAATTPASGRGSSEPDSVPAAPAAAPSSGATTSTTTTTAAPFDLGSYINDRTPGMPQSVEQIKSLTVSTLHAAEPGPSGLAAALAVINWYSEVQAHAVPLLHLAVAQMRLDAERIQIAEAQTDAERLAKGEMALTRVAEEAAASESAAYTGLQLSRSISMALTHGSAALTLMQKNDALAAQLVAAQAQLRSLRSQLETAVARVQQLSLGVGAAAVSAGSNRPVLPPALSSPGTTDILMDDGRKNAALVHHQQQQHHHHHHHHQQQQPHHHKFCDKQIVQSNEENRKLWTVEKPYTPSDENATGFAKVSVGTVVTVQNKHKTGWWWIEDPLDPATSGWFPASFLLNHS